MIAVGTTSCRTLEAVAAKYGEIRACSGNTSIFLYPGVKFNCIDGLITNFHLPESTLIMLVSALYGYEKTMAAYKVAVEERYRFFSFGDAMLILLIIFPAILLLMSLIPGFFMKIARLFSVHRKEQKLCLL